MLLYLSFQIFSNFLLSHIGGRKIFSDSGELVRTASRNTLLPNFVFGVTFTLVYYRMWLGGLRKKEEKRLYQIKETFGGEISFTNKKINKVRKREADKAEKCVNESYLEIFSLLRIFYTLTSSQPSVKCCKGSEKAPCQCLTRATICIN